MTTRTDRDDGEHAAKFAQVSRNLAVLATTLCVQHPQFPPGDFGRAFMVAALGLLLRAEGDVDAVNYLRSLADAIERGDLGAVGKPN